jgi:hypothetical protein
MHRFPNPSSAVDTIINCFNVLYENIDRDEAFGLFDMQEILVSNGLISSSGATGIRALLKGSNKDLSRDKSYNQCKMFAEIYRFLGWIQSYESALNFTFTQLGDHVASAVDEKPLVEMCFLGIEFPNELIEVSGNYSIRPFASIIKFMSELDGVLSRDEMILGPLSMLNDRDKTEWKRKVELIRDFRQKPNDFKKALSETLKSRGIKKATAENYTRFPLGALKWLNWAQPCRDKKLYKKSTHTYRMTETGKEISETLKSKLDFRLEDYEKLPTDSKPPIAKSTFYELLEIAGFDITDIRKEKSEWDQVTEKMLGHRVLFSPYQAIGPDELRKVFATQPPASKRESIYSPSITYEHKSYDAAYLALNEAEYTVSETHVENTFIKDIEPFLEAYSESEIISKLKSKYSTYSKDKFYPLIGNIFSVLGLDCEISPHGVNSRRWDAVIKSNDDSLPIEIKSPTEELNISVKAIRQAVENKIILQSRKSLKNKRPSTSLAVGFDLPANRAEVSQLISDFKSVFEIDIAVIGIDYLLKLAIKCLRNNYTLSFDELSTKAGIIND